MQAGDWRRIPPRLAGQPIFYSVLNDHIVGTIALVATYRRDEG